MEIRSLDVLRWFGATRTILFDDIPYVSDFVVMA